jgi:hypothetical protein
MHNGHLCGIMTILGDKVMFIIYTDFDNNCPNELIIAANDNTSYARELQIFTFNHKVNTAPLSGR